MAGLIGVSSKTLRVKEFRTSGTFTVSSGVKTVALFLVGGGGGSDVVYCGGQGGNVVEVNYDVDGKASCAVVIGAGGVGASSGGNTTFDGVVVARGGSANLGPTGGMGANAMMSSMIGKNGFGGCGITTASNNALIHTGNGASKDAGGTNTGAGGGANANGGSGYARVEWYE